MHSHYRHDYKLIPLKLPDDFQETYASHFGEAATNETYTHCKRELYQGVWDLILDERVKALLDQFSYAPTFVSANSVLPSHQVPS